MALSATRGAVSSMTLSAPRVMHEGRRTSPQAACVRCSATAPTARGGGAVARAVYTQPSWAQRMRATDMRAGGAARGGATAGRAKYTQPTWAQRMTRALPDMRAGSDVGAMTDEDEEDEGMDESRALAIRLAIEADNVKAEDIVVLHVEHHCSWASYFVIATARSRPQLEAVVGRMRDAAKEDFDRDFQKNNESSSQAWAVMDLGDVVCHVFTRQEREYYDLESFYAEAPVVSLPFLTQNPMDDWVNTDNEYEYEDAAVLPGAKDE